MFTLLCRWQTAIKLRYCQWSGGRNHFGQSIWRWTIAAAHTVIADCRTETMFSRLFILFDFFRISEIFFKIHFVLPIRASFSLQTYLSEYVKRFVGGCGFGTECFLVKEVGWSFRPKLLAKWPIWAFLTLNMGFSSLGKVV